MPDPDALAREILDAYAQKTPIAILPSARDGGLDLPGAYAVESAIVRLRRAGGRTAVGLKVGYANKAVWRALKLDTLTWAHMYDDTVHRATGNTATLPIDRMFAPKIEAEIVFKLKRPLVPGADAAAALDAVEWIAPGFEVVDNLYPGGKFQPADFVASKGFHAALVLGDPRAVAAADIPALAGQMALFTVRLMKNGELAAEGGGKNVLRSPALCLAELGSALARQAPAEPLGAAALISSGSLTDAQPAAGGEHWTVEFAGIDLAPLGVRLA